jgi:hypothetical protein
MGIVGDHPEAGIRFDLTRQTRSAPWVYAGSAFTSDVVHPLSGSIDAAGVVVIAEEGKLPKEVAQRLTLLLRTTWKRVLAERPDGLMPRRLHRWRAA